MKADEMIAAAVLEPATLACLGRAFDGAWQEIKDNYATEPAISRARQQLAHSALAVVAAHAEDVDALKRAMLAHMAEHYPDDRKPSGER